MTIRPGMQIKYRRDSVESTAVVIAIERCVLRDGMAGERVRELPWTDRDFGFFTLDNGYCHGSELVQ